MTCISNNPTWSYMGTSVLYIDPFRCAPVGAAMFGHVMIPLLALAGLCCLAVYNASAVQQGTISAFVAYNDCMNGTELWPKFHKACKCHISILPSSFHPVQMLQALLYSVPSRMWGLKSFSKIVVHTFSNCIKSGLLSPTHCVFLYC